MKKPQLNSIYTRCLFLAQLEKNEKLTTLVYLLFWLLFIYFEYWRTNPKKHLNELRIANHLLHTRFTTQFKPMSNENINTLPDKNLALVIGETTSIYRISF